MMDQGFVMVEHWISDWHQPFGFLSCSRNLKCEKVLWPEDATVYLFFFTTVSSVCCHLFPLFILGIKAEQSLLMNATWVLQPIDILAKMTPQFSLFQDLWHSSDKQYHGISDYVFILVDEWHWTFNGQKKFCREKDGQLTQLQALQNIELLNLEGNRLSDWKTILRLGHLPR